MSDKFFTTVRDRFEFHAEPIRENLKFLEYLASDYYGHVSPDFIAALEEAKSQLRKMQEAIEELKVR